MKTLTITADTHFAGVGVIITDIPDDVANALMRLPTENIQRGGGIGLELNLEFTEQQDTIIVWEVGREDHSETEEPRGYDHIDLFL